MNNHLPEKLFVVCGLPRSGKTMISKVIGSHSQIAVPGSGFNFFYWFDEEKFRARGGFAENLDFFFKECRKSESFKMSPGSVDNTGEDQRDLYCSLLDGFRKSNFPEKKYYGEYSHLMEENFDQLVQWFGPERLKCVQIVRNPIDNYASYVVARKARLREDGNKDSYNAFVHKFCNMWGKSTTLGLYYAAKYPESFKVIFFEDFKENPDRAVRSLCAWFGVSPEPERMLEMADYESKSNTAFGEQKGAGAGFVRKDDHRRKEVLKRHEIEAIQSITCLGLADLTGYGNRKVATNWKTFVEKDPVQISNDTRYMIWANMISMSFVQIVSVVLRLVGFLLRDVFLEGGPKFIRRLKRIFKRKIIRRLRRVL
jgi:hypothetical protein